MPNVTIEDEKVSAAHTPSLHISDEAIDAIALIILDWVKQQEIDLKKAA